ncbi:MAG TPA: hypothetical protein VLA12_05305, partial [Planctomycetaceae bacterium]|nr:hypothetical protein [Planctomycetaceae bacterium]
MLWDQHIPEVHPLQLMRMDRKRSTSIGHDQKSATGAERCSIVGKSGDLILQKILKQQVRDPGQKADSETKKFKEYLAFWFSSTYFFDRRGRKTTQPESSRFGAGDHRSPNLEKGEKKSCTGAPSVSIER